MRSCWTHFWLVWLYCPKNKHLWPGLAVKRTSHSAYSSWTYNVVGNAAWCVWWRGRESAGCALTLATRFQLKLASLSCRRRRPRQRVRQCVRLIYLSRASEHRHRRRNRRQEKVRGAAEGGPLNFVLERHSIVGAPTSLLGVWNSTYN